MFGLPLHLAQLSKQEQSSTPVAQNASSAGDAPTANAARTNFPEEIQLFLPSSIPASYRIRVCDAGTIDAEKRLRLAQLTDCLVNIRRALRIRTRMIRWKNHQITGQSLGTRSRAVVDRMQQRLDTIAQKYREARIALMSLDSSVGWQTIWRDLQPSDITSYVDTEQSMADAVKYMRRGMRPGGETRRILSWIWTTTAGVNGAAESQEDQNTGLEGMDESKQPVRYAGPQDLIVGVIDSAQN